MIISSMICPLCDRDIDPGDGDDHHLVPKQKGGKKGDVVHLHRFCHTKIHSIFTNGELKKTYSTVTALRQHPEIEKFVLWVQGKPSGFYSSNRKKNK